MRRLFQLLTPYLAVLIFWCAFHSAWLAILAYHMQVVFWSRHRFRYLWAGSSRSLCLTVALPCVLAGPLAYFLLPVMSGDTALTGWLARYGLSGLSWSLMIPYFGLVHPIFEQAHWSGLRRNGWPAHLSFAGYHALVLYSLLQPFWLLFCLVVLFCASVLWSRIDDRTWPGINVSLCTHVLADLGIVLAAWLRTT